MQTRGSMNYNERWKLKLIFLIQKFWISSNFTIAYLMYKYISVWIFSASYDSILKFRKSMHLMIEFFFQKNTFSSFINYNSFYGWTATIINRFCDYCHTKNWSRVGRIEHDKLFVNLSAALYAGGILLKKWLKHHLDYNQQPVEIDIEITVKVYLDCRK